MTDPPLLNLVPYTCFNCRSTYKRPFEAGVLYRKCPTCGDQALRMDSRFRPPKKSDEQQWQKIIYLVKHGFNFQKVYRKEGPVWHRACYPQNLEQAKAFVIEFKDQAHDFGI